MTYTQRSRPGEKAAPQESQLAGGDKVDSTENLAAMRRRREAALRSVPLSDGCRDPQFDLPRTDVPCSFGLSPAELWRHGAALQRDGWTADEIAVRLADPRAVAS